MADVQTPSRGGTPAVVPMKRQFEDEHAPSVSSPLNPDAAARRAQSSRPTPAVGREQREKKESLKKRESSGSVAPGSFELSIKKAKTGDENTEAPSPIRYNHSLPRDAFHYAIRDPVFTSHEPEPIYTPQGIELKKPLDHAENKKSFHYTHCIADPNFKHIRYYRQSDSKPYGPRMSFEDSDKWFHFDESATIVTNQKGWRMGRGNVAVREGRFYYEVKILQGVPREGPPVSSTYTPAQGPLPHIRMGWARREAPLDTPVGFDGYSYGLTDIRLEPMHKSRAHKYLDDGSDRSTNALTTKKVAKSKSKAKQKEANLTNFTADDHAREGDVIGLEISLPSISLHRKVVDGSYNPAIDVGPGFEIRNEDERESALNIVRDRFPVPYKGSMYFESIEYRSTKGMDAYGDRGPFAKETPSPNHNDPSIRSLPRSSIKIWKNGKRIGTAFRNLMAFLPPASAPSPEKGVRQGLDDGMLGYYPAIGVFSGGMAEVNFGPDFWFPPPGLNVDLSSSSSNASSADMLNATVENFDIQVKVENSDSADASDAMIIDQQPHILSSPTTKGKSIPSGLELRPVSERYVEQIVEDIMYDIIDEVDFFVEDGGILSVEE